MVGGERRDPIGRVEAVRAVALDDVLHLQLPLRGQLGDLRGHQRRERGIVELAGLHAGADRERGDGLQRQDGNRRLALGLLPARRQRQRGAHHRASRRVGHRRPAARLRPISSSTAVSRRAASRDVGDAGALGHVLVLLQRLERLGEGLARAGLLGRRQVDLALDGRLARLQALAGRPAGCAAASGSVRRDARSPPRPRRPAPPASSRRGRGGRPPRPAASAAAPARSWRA